MGGKELWNKVNEKVTKVQSESETGRENRVTNVRQIVTLLTSNMADCIYRTENNTIAWRFFIVPEIKNFLQKFTMNIVSLQ